MSSGTVVAGHAFRQIRMSASIVAVVFAGTIAATASSYSTTFPTEESRQQVAQLASGDRGLAILFGPTTAIGTVGGYTVYKCFVFLAVIGSLWALLATTRLLRGEEDAGRWQLVLAGAIRPSRATAVTIAALGAAIGVIFVVTAFGVALVGRSRSIGFGIGESLLCGMSLIVLPAVFVGVAAVTSQIGGTRRMATTIAMAVFVGSYVVRMIGDSSGTLQWMLWTTPFGWTELVQPLTMNDPWPIGIGFVVAIALAALATVGAKHRDVGDGLLATSDVKQLRRFGLQSSFRFSLRLELPVVVAWCGGAAAVAVVYGIISKMTVTSVPASLNNVLDRFAVQGTFANQFFGVAFLLVAAVVALIPAGQLGAASAEETSGRLEHLLSRSTTRAGWFVGRLVICACAIVAAAVVSGVGAWFGASTQGVPVSFGSLLGAGLNVVPTALVALGIGAVVFAFAPRSAATIVYVVVIWSVLLDLLSSLVTGAAWLDRVSLFAPMALAPAQSIHASTLLITGAIGIALCMFGTLLFARRDLANR
ncbi:MAG: hypothetical protein WCK41_12015 [Actinomycetes bacterium]